MSPPTHRNRFPRRCRLSGSRRFKAVYAGRKRRQAGPLAVYAIPNGLDHCRLGLSVPRAAGGAVRRNRVKRLLREAFRLGHRDLPTGYDLVIAVRPHAPLALADYRNHLTAAVRHLHKRWSARRGEADNP